jgi:hypothetical protein
MQSRMCDSLEVAINELESTEIFNNDDINNFLDLVDDKTDFEKLQELINTLNMNLCILYKNDMSRINQLYNKYVLGLNVS